MANRLLPDSIPVGVHLTMIQAYNDHLHQWQAHAAAKDGEVQLLSDRITDLEKENEELRDCRDILERMVDVQRQLLLAADAGRQCSESSSTLSSIDAPEMNSYHAGAFPYMEPADRNTHLADSDVGGPSKPPRVEPGGGLQIADLLRS